MPGTHEPGRYPEGGPGVTARPPCRVRLRLRPWTIGPDGEPRPGAPFATPLEAAPDAILEPLRRAGIRFEPRSELARDEWAPPPRARVTDHHLVLDLWGTRLAVPLERARAFVEALARRPDLLEALVGRAWADAQERNMRALYERPGEPHPEQPTTRDALPDGPARWCPGGEEP